MKSGLAFIGVCALLMGCPSDDGPADDSGAETGTSPTPSTSNPTTSSSSSPSTSVGPDTDTDTDTDTDANETDSSSSSSGGEANCEAQVNEADCHAASDIETECAWLTVELYGDDLTCQIAETTGFCTIGLSDYDCGSSGVACGAREATAYHRAVEGGTEVTIVEWWICNDYLPPQDFAQCEEGDVGLEPAACTCACTD